MKLMELFKKKVSDNRNVAKEKDANEANLSDEVMTGPQFKPNTAYPIGKSWKEIYNELKELNGKRMWINLELTQDLFEHSDNVYGVRNAYAKGFLEIEARLNEDNNVVLCVLAEQNGGDSDGFGVEPDYWLQGVVAPDGTFVKPLHV